GGSTSYYQNNGNGTFAASKAVATQIGKVAVGDVNGDNNLDVVWSTSGFPIQTALGAGNGSFGAATNINGVNHASERLLLEDIDNDGDLDIVSFFGSVIVYQNNGFGVFAELMNAIVPSVATAWTGAFADFDGDGDLDVVLALGAGNTPEIQWNNGRGVF